MSDPDPRGLIRESYRIEGIAPEDCRTIFLDWAIGLPEATNVQEALKVLLMRYGADAPDHPMTAVLREGLTTHTPVGGRRRGRRRS